MWLSVASLLYFIIFGCLIYVLLSYSAKDAEVVQERNGLEAFQRNLERQVKELEEELDIQRRELTSGVQRIHIDQIHTRGPKMARCQFTQAA